MNIVNWKEAYQVISNAKRIALMTHENPDGDGLGCAAALHHYLNGINCENKIVIHGDLPLEYGFLNTNNIFESYSEEKHSFWLKDVDLVILLDIGDIKRLNSIKKEVEQFNLPIMNIDHHPTVDETVFTWNYVNTNASATGEMIYDYFKINKIENIGKEIFEGLYTAVLTDTGSFRYSNTSELSHEIAIEAIKNGVDHTAIYQKIYESKSHQWIRLLGSILTKLNYELDGKLGWFVIDKQMLADTGAHYKDIDGFTDFVRTIQGVEVSLMIVENDNETCRVNFRSKGKYIVNNVAKMFNGGGHKFAAGAVVSGKIEKVAPEIVSKMVESMKGLVVA